MSETIREFDEEFERRQMKDKSTIELALDIDRRMKELEQYKQAAEYHGLVLMVESNGRCSYFNESKFMEQMQKTIYRAISESVDMEVKLKAALKKHGRHSMSCSYPNGCTCGYEEALA